MIEFISSTANDFYKKLQKLLQTKRERIKQDVVLLEGVHLVESAIEAGWVLKQLIISASGLENPEVQRLKIGHSCVYFADSLFKELTDVVTPVGVLGVFERRRQSPISTSGCVLLLEQVQDPGNVGAILRTASAMGVNQVWLTPGSADPWSPKVLRAGMGAHFFLDIQEAALDDLPIAAFEGAVAITTLEGASPLYDVKLEGDILLAMGNEGAGVSEKLANMADIRIHIPMSPGVESLNVATATAMCLYERSRQLAISTRI